MKTSQLIAAVLGVVILLCGVVVPLIAHMNETTGDPVYSDNESYATRMAKATSLGSAITLEKTADGVTANGVAKTDYVIVASSIAVNVGSTAVIWIHTGETTTTGTLSWTTGDKLVFNGSAWTLTPAQDSQTTAASGTFSWIFYPSNDGVYIRANTESTGAVNVDDGAEVVAFGFLSTTKQCVLTGTVASLSILYGASSVAGSSIAISSEESGYTNSLESVMVGNATHALQVIVPLQYTSGMNASIVTTLVGILPVLIIAALVISIGYRIVSERGDY